MTCALCHWWRPSRKTETDEHGVPHHGRCVARPPQGRLFAVKDVEEWNDSILACVWPETLSGDICGGFLSLEVAAAMEARAHAPGENDTLN